MAPDGTLAPWTSPTGTPMAIAAATPTIPWSDLISSLTPNGRWLAAASPHGQPALNSRAWAVRLVEAYRKQMNDESLTDVAPR